VDLRSLAMVLIGLIPLGIWLYKKYKNRPKQEEVVYKSPTCYIIIAIIRK
jgi:hypothetical protein